MGNFCVHASVQMCVSNLGVSLCLVVFNSNIDNRSDRHMISDDDMDTTSALTDKEQFKKEDLLPVDQEDEETDKVCILTGDLDFVFVMYVYF